MAYNVALTLLKVDHSLGLIKFLAVRDPSATELIADSMLEEAWEYAPCALILCLLESEDQEAAYALGQRTGPFTQGNILGEASEMLKKGIISGPQFSLITEFLANI